MDVAFIVKSNWISQAIMHQLLALGWVLSIDSIQFSSFKCQQSTHLFPCPVELLEWLVLLDHLLLLLLLLVIHNVHERRQRGKALPDAS